MPNYPYFAEGTVADHRRQLTEGAGQSQLAKHARITRSETLTPSTPGRQMPARALKFVGIGVATVVVLVGSLVMVTRTAEGTTPTPVGPPSTGTQVKDDVAPSSPADVNPCGAMGTKRVC